MQPPVTLVVPLRNEEESILALLSSIDDQTTPPEQVVLVDGGSTDGTLGIIRAHAGGNARYTVVEAVGGATPGRGRNLGFASARNDWIAMTDAGIRLEPTWMERLWAAHLSAPAAEVIYGNYEFDLRSFFEECAAVSYCDTKHSTPVGRCRAPQVVSCLVSRRAIETVGGFADARSGEDEIFVRALEAARLPVTWAPDATVWWRLRPDLRSTFERFRSYSYHYALAGQQRHWHHRMARSYLPVAAGLVLACTSSRRWLVLPAAMISARSGVRIRRHRREMDVLRHPGPARVGLITFLVVANDVATALGWCQATLHRRSSGRDSRVVTGGRAGGRGRHAGDV